LQHVEFNELPDVVIENLDSIVSEYKNSDQFAKRLITDGEALLLAPFYRSLVNAIKNCQNGINNVDWHKWTQNYF
jgi:hypothetical protein